MGSCCASIGRSSRVASCSGCTCNDDNSSYNQTNSSKTNFSETKAIVSRTRGEGTQTEPTGPGGLSGAKSTGKPPPDLCGVNNGVHHWQHCCSLNMPYRAKLWSSIDAHTSDVNGVCFGITTLATCGGDKVVRVWDLKDFSEASFSPLQGHRYSINGCIFSPDGATLVSYSTDGKAFLWDIKTGERVGVLVHPSQASIKVCRFSPRGDLIVTGSDDETLCLWDVATMELIRSYGGHEASLPAAAFCPAGRFIVCGNVLGYLKVFDALGQKTEHLWYEMNAHDLGVTCCAFSPTYGSAGEVSMDPPKVHYLLATCGYDNNIKLWDFTALIDNVNVTLRLRSKLTGHGDSVMDCKFSPDGSLLASAAGDKTVRLWNPIKGHHIFTILGHSRFVTSCSFSIDGKYIASGSNDRSVKVWRLTHNDQDGAELPMVLPASTAVPGSTAVPQAAYYMTDPETWTVNQVSQWLADNGMQQYVDQFKNHAIDGIELLTLTDPMLEKNFSISVLGHRNKLLRAIEDIREQHAQELYLAANGTPDEYICPITREIMTDPVLATDGFTYERKAITDWMKRGKRYSPMTNVDLTSDVLTPNRSVKMLIQRYLASTQSQVPSVEKSLSGRNDSAGTSSKP